MGYINPVPGQPYLSKMDMKSYKGEPVADPGKFIRLTLRGQYVRWRLDNELAGFASIHGSPARTTDQWPRVTPD